MQRRGVLVRGKRSSEPFLITIQRKKEEKLYLLPNVLLHLYVVNFFTLFLSFNSESNSVSLFVYLFS